MSFKSVLDKIAEDALIVTKAIGPSLPIVNMALLFLPQKAADKIHVAEGKVIKDISLVDDIVKSVQAIGALGNVSGPQKLDMVTGSVVAAFSDVMSVAEHEVKDKDLMEKSRQEFNAAMRLLSQSRVDFYKAIEGKP